MDSCLQCRYFVARAYKLEDLGECRAAPPAPNGSVRGLFPFVEPGDWCGSFRHRGEGVAGAEITTQQSRTWMR